MKFEANFIFVVCQAGAEATLREEILTNHPELRLAYSRPGFVTFKCDPENRPAERFHLKSVLARSYGWSLGKATGNDGRELVKQIVAQDAAKEAASLHVWERDRRLPGAGGFEPGVSVLANQVGQEIVAEISGVDATRLNRVVNPDEMVFDVCLVEPNEWWFGYHFATGVAMRWPGGCPIFDTSTEVISRAYFKLKEGLLWSGLPVEAGDVCAEIGSSPGGACQLLLEKDCRVIAVDPAELEEDIAMHENLTHIRRRGHEVKRRDFREAKWLFADISMVPGYTLDTVSAIVEHESVNVKGMLLTLKLTDWKLTGSVSEWMSRVRSLGFKHVRVRQLAFNRKELCLFAAKDRYLLRAGKK